MGYTTDFDGHFTIDKPIDNETFNLINGLANTRRMGRKDLDPKYGVEGEFYYDPNSNNFGQEDDNSIIDHNTPPKTQPGLWLQWVVDDDHQTIRWDENEKFYDYVEWIEYIINRILKPRGYKVNGIVYWEGEDGIRDTGEIEIKDNEVMVYVGEIHYTR